MILTRRAHISDEFVDLRKPDGACKKEHPARKKKSEKSR